MSKSQPPSAMGSAKDTGVLTARAEKRAIDPSRAAWHAVPADAVAVHLRTDAARGLTNPEVTLRLERYGRNELASEEKEPWWKAAFEALTEPLVLLLIAVGVLYTIFGRVEDAITIFVVITAVAAVEAVTEARAKRAITALSTLTLPQATAIRAGELWRGPTSALVPGDLVVLDPGSRVPADLRLVETAALRVDESSLTGESLPVDKRADVIVPAETALGDRVNLAFAGTTVAGGQGLGVVVATAGETELGRIAALARSASAPRTPLQQQLRTLAGWLLWLAIALSVLVPTLSVVISGRPWREALLEGLTLAFATIPEELPILVTVVLGMGAYRLAKEHAITKRLQAAETLGSVSVIGTDKTGTLTENRMHVAEIFADDVRQPLVQPESDTVRRLLRIGALATGAKVSEDANGTKRFLGDPTDTALLKAAQADGLLDVRDRVNVLAEFPFDDERKRIATIYESDGERWLVLKGAPERVLPHTARVRRGDEVFPLEEPAQSAIARAVDEMAASGLRVIAFAERRLAPEAELTTALETDLTFVGLAGLEDPPRPEVPSAIGALKAAGVRVLMLTGDHPATARAIATRVGINAARVVTGPEVERASGEALGALVRGASVFARISPEHKLRLVSALQADGETVAVTGDGVNDAPALRQAAIGIAMGERGTDVAREAADLVLSDDNFATVVSAVRGGRVLFENLRKAVRYYLAAKVALITASLIAVLAGLPLPFAPVQIIVLELFMDLGASTTFVAEPAEGDVMARPPRDPRRKFMDLAMVLGILGGGLSLAAAVWVPYLWSIRQGLGDDVARTAAFAAWLVGHIVLAIHMRSERQPLFTHKLRVTRPFALWALAAVGLAVTGPLLPFLSRRLYLVPLSKAAWIVVTLAALILPSWWEIAKVIHWHAPQANDNAPTVGSTRHQGGP